jgi:hypothetical protein
MGLVRLGISNPSANTATTIFTSDNQYLVSVIATNKSSSAVANIRVWVQPSGSSTESQYSYIVYDIPVDSLNSYETFRFAINQNDVVRIQSSTANVSFSAYGIVQYDIRLGAGISSYSATAPINPVDGMIWIDSSSSIPGSAAKIIKIYSASAASWISTAAAGIDNTANYAFTGTVSATTQAVGDNSTKLATTAFVSAGFEKTIPLQSSAPASPASSDLWVDNTDPLKPILKVYNGTSWITAGSSITADDDQIILASRVFG